MMCAHRTERGPSKPERCGLRPLHHDSFVVPVHQKEAVRAPGIAIAPFYRVAGGHRRPAAGKRCSDGSFEAGRECTLSS